MRNIIAHLLLAATITTLAAVTSGTATAASAAQQGTPVASISPGDGALVGVATPIRIQFAAPVADRARAQRSVSVGALPGRLSWTGDRELTWNPIGYLPANAPLTVSVGAFHTQLETDAGTIADGNMSSHTFTVTIPGQAPRVMPASFGKPGRESPVGTFPVMEKDRTLIFDSRTIGIPLSDPEGYYLTGEFAERLTTGGVFVHSAPWSVNQQGHSNVSHGCVNLSPANAEWYFDNVRVGDPVTLHW
jgi:lipoprotein-anchoring transpeptidase ErfK/SrfK